MHTDDGQMRHGNALVFEQISQKKKTKVLFKFNPTNMHTSAMIITGMFQCYLYICNGWLFSVWYVCMGGVLAVTGAYCMYSKCRGGGSKVFTTRTSNVCEALYWLWKQTSIKIISIYLSQSKTWHTWGMWLLIFAILANSSCHIYLKITCCNTGHQLTFSLLCWVQICAHTVP